MKRIVFVFPLILLMGLVTIKPANSQSQSYKWESPFEYWIPCANDGIGEWITGSLKVHWVFHSNKDGSLTTMNGQLHSLDLIGMETGDSYRLQRVWNYKFDIEPIGEGAYTTRWIYKMRIVGNGVKFTWITHQHLTIRPDGTIVVDINNENIECE